MLLLRSADVAALPLSFSPNTVNELRDSRVRDFNMREWNGLSTRFGIGVH